MSKWCMSCKYYLKDERMCVCIGGRHCSDFVGEYFGCEKFEDKEEDQMSEIVSTTKGTLARECIICDNTFEINMIGDDRPICPKCKRFLKMLVELYARYEIYYEFPYGMKEESKEE